MFDKLTDFLRKPALVKLFFFSKKLTSFAYGLVSYDVKNMAFSFHLNALSRRMFPWLQTQT